MNDKYILFGIQAEKFALNGLTTDNLKQYLKQISLFGTVEEFKALDELKQKLNIEACKCDEGCKSDETYHFVKTIVDKVVETKTRAIQIENEKLRKIIKENLEAHEKIINYLNNINQGEVK